MKIKTDRSAEIQELGLSSSIVDAYCVLFDEDPNEVDLDDVEEAYQGTFSDDDEFAEDFADGEYSAEDLMQSHYEEDGHYFRIG